jgi:histidine triad (HIT) family protein
MNPSNSLEIPDPDRCAFCEYLEGLRPFTVLERGVSAAILVTREQRGVGHVLVLPVEHRESVLDLSSMEATAIMDGIIRVAHAIDTAFERPGIAIWQNNGVPAHQKIPHAHFHVAGTVDGGGTKWGPVRELSIAETDAIAARLRPFLRAAA